MDCSLTLLSGEVRAVIGENGSGKSTLVKVLSGLRPPDAGTISWLGEGRSFFRTPREAQESGISTVFQETLVADDLSVVDNIVMGTDGMLRRGRPLAQERARARAILDELGLDGVSLDTPLSQLSLARRHLVAVARSLLRPWRLLILDEATSALDVEDRDRLFDIVRREVSDRRAVLFITHRLDEIALLADQVTVLRSGASIATVPVAEASRDTIVQLMAPPVKQVQERVRQHERPQSAVATPDDAVLVATDIRLRPSAAPFSLTVGQGEVLGLAGLEGHGQADFLQTLAGWFAPNEGRVTVRDKSGAWVQIEAPSKALKHGVAYVPVDRKREGIFAALPVSDNLLLPSLYGLTRWGIIGRTRQRSLAATLMDRMHVQAPGADAAVESLSGGNQQKVLLGRWVNAAPRVLLLNDPMRGVDPNSKTDLLDVLTDLVAEGLTIVLLSTELEELVTLCGRVAVFRDQALVAVLERAQLDETQIVRAMLGLQVEAGTDDAE